MSFYHDPPIREETAAVLIKILCPSSLPEKSSWRWMGGTGVLRTEPPRTAASSPVAAKERKEGCCFTSGSIYGVSTERGKVGSHVRESGEGRRPAHLESGALQTPAGRDTRTETQSASLLASSFLRLLTTGTGNMCTWVV